jgi:acetyltransferase
MLTEIPPRLARELNCDRAGADEMIRQHLKADSGFLTEADAKQILSAYGIPTNPTATALTEDDAVARAEKMGFPVALKLVSPDISHKTDADGVHLDVRTADDVRRAYNAIVEGAKRFAPDADISGVSVQRYIHKPDYELLIGAKSDPAFGPVIMFGMGGIFTEVMKDRHLGLPPLNRLLARRLMENTRAFQLLKGYRNRPAADLEALEALLIRLSHLLTDFPQIAELDMNPVLVKDGEPCAVDARLRLEMPKKDAPLHLVISPYPGEYEFQETREDGRRFMIRPIKPEDAHLFQELFEVLSQTSIYQRFFSTLKALSPSMLARFTQIDYDREIALVAIDPDSASKKMLGVARIIGDPDGKTGEFSVLVGDPWHGQGIGGLLLGRALQIAKQRGIETVWGFVLKENRGMLALGEKLGFGAKAGEDAGEMVLKIDLESPGFGFLDEIFSAEDLPKIEGKPQ